MLIRKGNKTNVTANFTEEEYFNAAFGDVGNSFELSTNTIIGGQIIRDYFGNPMKVNATFRTVAHEKAQGRSGNGQHPNKRAIDYGFIGANREETMLKYHQEILTKGTLFKKLRAAGISGFGLYDNFLHIDSRTNATMYRDEFGAYNIWDDRITTKKKSQR